MRRFLTVLSLLFLLTVRQDAADLLSSGSWARTITASDLGGPPGSDLTSTYESIMGASALTVLNSGGNQCHVYARRSDGNWNANLSLLVRRTSSGTGSGTISGGTSFIELTTINTEIFSTSGDLSNVGLQFRLTGVSKNVSPNIYNSTVIFTVVQ